ncbi:hypothetical protein ZHAS_00004624 [Anopheles sinensis]|uniref:Small ribosomal subunit protein eS6 n=1 Tax=Anopheles sinensis TaxID=74873 RepID=A0A084VH63_ANOSI|nr:hypothetical protein ZHAS_00004624 [Anopheles sinensis]
MGKSKKRPRPTSPTTNDSPGKKIKPTTHDPPESATVETAQSSLATEVKQSEEELNARVREWIEAREDGEATLPPPEDESDAEDEDEARINQLWVESITGSFKHQLLKMSEEEKRKSFKYECEWKECSFMTGKDHRYFRHIETHAAEVQIEGDLFKCRWDLCSFSTTKQSIFDAHVHVHGYHTKLKVHGASLSRLANLPKCGYDSRTRNDISKISLSYTCEWPKCGETFDKIMQFIYHVVYHYSDQLPRGKKSTKETISCLWPLCDGSFTHLSHCLKHLRKHTQQREVACFNCGALFFERTIYRNHCLRQVDLRYRKFKCDECDKYFTTERLLKNHADHHVLHVPCPKCPGRFPTPSAMTNHLRRVHLKMRPMECTQCEYRAYGAAELKKHMNRHSAKRLFRCDEFGCNATFRCENTLKIVSPVPYTTHIIKHYNLPPPHYACHLCEAGYASGWLLSKHLNFEHEVKPKPGTFRYRYRVDPDDGFYKLDVYFAKKKQEQERARREGSDWSEDDDDDDDNDGNTEQNIKPAEAKTTINEIKMIGEHAIAIELGMELSKEGNTDQTEEQTTVTDGVTIKKENVSPLKNKEKPGTAELKEDKKTNKSKKVQEFTLNVSFPATGAQKTFDIPSDDHSLRFFFDKRMGAEVLADPLGEEWKGYVLKIAGGNDKQGFPMKQGVLTNTRVRLLLKKGHSCYRPRRTGERKRKSVRGCIVDQNLSALALIIVRKGEKDIPGLTDTHVLRRLGPKRANNIRKLYNLTKEDDVRQFVVKRPLPAKEGKKPRHKAPKIQRLITPVVLQRKRHRLLVKKRRTEARREAEAEYSRILTLRRRQERVRRRSRLSSMRDSRSSLTSEKDKKELAAAKKKEAAAKKEATKKDAAEPKKDAGKKDAGKKDSAKKDSTKKDAAGKKDVKKDAAGKKEAKKPAAAAAGGKKEGAKPDAKKGDKKPAPKTEGKKTAASADKKPAKDAPAASKKEAPKRKPEAAPKGEASAAKKEKKQQPPKKK